MKNEEIEFPMTNMTSTFSYTETTGGIPAPPESNHAYESYQEQIDMEVKNMEKYKK